MEETQLKKTIPLLPPEILAGVEEVISLYEKETGQQPTETQTEYIYGLFTIALMAVMYRAIQNLKLDMKMGKKHTPESIKAYYPQLLEDTKETAKSLILELDKSPVKSYALALQPFKNEPYKETEEVRCFEAVLLIRGVFEKGILPFGTDEVLTLLNAQIREYREKGLIGFSTSLEVKGGEDTLSLVCGNLPEMAIKLVAQTTRKNGEIAFNKKGYMASEEERITESGEAISYISIEKNIQGRAYSKLTVKKDLAPTHERAMTILVYVLHKIQEAIFIKSHKSHKSGLDIELNINDLVGEGKPFTRKQYALEPFKQVIEFLPDIKFKSHYPVGSSEYRKLSISLLGRIDERKGDAIEEMNIFTSFVAYQDGTCIFHLNDNIKDFSPIFHKIATLPFYGNKYNDKEQGLFLLLMYKYRSGKRKNSICKIKNDDLIDFFGFGNISKERNKQRFLKEALRILESVKEKDNKEYFEVFDIDYNKKENTAYKMLKSLTVSIRVRAEKIYLVEGVKGEKND